MFGITAWRPPLVRGVVVLVMASAGLCGCVGTLQKQFIFPGSRTMDLRAADAGIAIEEVQLRVDRYRTMAWYAPVDGARGTVLYSHGNGGNLSRELLSIEMLQRFGLSVLAYDYGGYGESSGRPSEARCYHDVRAAWDYLVEQRQVAPERIVLFGRSLGGGPTLELAQSVHPAGIVLESTFLSIPAVAKGTSFRLTAGLIRHDFDNEEKIGAITAPVLIIHSPDDEVVPYEQGQRLFALAPEPKYFLEVRGGHNTSHILSNPEYPAAWEAFLDGCLGSSAT